MSVKRPDILLKGFKITLSFKTDCTEDDDEVLIKWLEKKADMWHVVAEHGTTGKRHLHALMCRKTPTAKRSIQDTLWKKFKESHSDSVQKYAIRVDVLYDDRWYREYLSKEDTHVLLSSKYDASLEHEYYATAEQQVQLQSIVTVSELVDPFYGDLAEKFTEWFKGRFNGVSVEISRTHCVEFLYWRMYVSKTMKVIADDRRRLQMAFALYRYVTKDMALDFEDRKACASKDGPVFDFRG